MQTNHEELVQFILVAREKGWAGNAEKVSDPQRPGFTEYVYFKDQWEYRDSYTGYYSAPGQEIVSLNGTPIWNMAYNGGMLPDYRNLNFSTEVYAFLRRTLLRVDPVRPFRGPNKFVQGDFEYQDESKGDIAQFRGRERILYKGLEVFSQDYIGGLIVHKSPSPQKQ